MLVITDFWEAKVRKIVVQALATEKISGPYFNE
jgi:hypothetical protein